MLAYVVAATKLIVPEGFKASVVVSQGAAADSVPVTAAAVVAVAIS